MATFTGQLRPNEIFSALFNMIISQQVFADNIKGTHASLVDKARVDGTLYGDTKLYYATDCLKSVDWGNDAEAENLLALHRPPAPKCQAITLDKYRQISLTVDNYLTKKAWGTENAFSEFNSVMLGWIRDTKRVYDSTTYNAYIGTHLSEARENTISIDTTAGATDLNTLDKDKLEAMLIAQRLADLFVEMSDVSRDFNDYEFLRSYDMSDITVVWNSAWVNKIRKIDLPTVFHKEGLMDKFDEEVLPARYFGNVNAVATAGAENGSVRSLIEQQIGNNHYFAGDSIKQGDTAPAGTSYTVDSGIICKVMTKLPPYMSSFEVGTSFFNPKSLTENHYLTWGHNTIEYLKNYPFITVQQA